MINVASLKAAMAMVRKVKAEIGAIPNPDIMIPDIVDRLDALETDIFNWIEAERSVVRDAEKSE